MRQDKNKTPRRSEAAHSDTLEELSNFPSSSPSFSAKAAAASKPAGKGGKLIVRTVMCSHKIEVRAANQNNCSSAVFLASAAQA